MIRTLEGIGIWFIGAAAGWYGFKLWAEGNQIIAVGLVVLGIALWIVGSRMWTISW
ncbi:Uncharacterised protein [Candidatus Gugararchaeum adminiculabundum]|nr:Uncharacterised protein [Candidatus Gugararchaeum adminiculabundum]